ncbi:hypothetical protein DAT35_45845 [Vitiosangium sp. GDMCC 1.1324]|nr:hypothetical protein DAT35_45845 [Vitiosangium sp. GDMCC 1.1324]
MCPQNPGQAQVLAAHCVDSGDTVPICAMARLGDGQLRNRPESKPGTAILEFSIADAFIVDSFRCAHFTPRAPPP